MILPVRNPHAQEAFLDGIRPTPYYPMASTTNSTAPTTW
jgi:hypothetical protein